MKKREAGKPPFLVLNKKSLKCLAVLGDLEPINKQVEPCPYDHFADPAQHRINPAEAGMPRP
jgi:hypothetical protein